MEKHSSLRWNFEEQLDAEPTAVRFGEALMGAPVTRDIVSLLVIEANILPRQ